MRAIVIGNNFIFEFEHVEDDWVLISGETIQSEIMSPSNQDESLKLGNLPEREVEIEKAGLTF